MGSSFITVFQKSRNKGSRNKVFISAVLPRLKGFKATAIDDIMGSKDY